MKRAVLAVLMLATFKSQLSIAQTEERDRQLTIYTTDANGNKVPDSYSSRLLDMNDSGRFMFNSGPGQNVEATHNAPSPNGIAITDMLLQETEYVVSPEFGGIIADEPTLNISPDGQYLVMRPQDQMAHLYTSDASPIYLYHVPTQTLTPIVTSFDGSPLTGCTHQWASHNWTRPSFSLWQNEVIYFSDCDNIVPNDNNNASDIFSYDIDTGETQLLTQFVDANGNLVQADGDSVSPKSSDSGQFIVFASEAKNIDSNPCSEQGYFFYLLDRTNGSYVRLNDCDDPKHVIQQFSYGISADGTTVAANGKFIGGERPSKTNMYVYNTVTGERERFESFYRNGNISLSYDGQKFAFIATAFYDINGQFTLDATTFGAMLTWDRITDTFVSRSTEFFTGDPLPNADLHDKIMLSAAGDFIYFAGSQTVFWKETIGFGDNSYHEFIGNEFARGSKFVTLRGTFNNWSSFSNMRLVNDHVWEGEIVITDNNARFKFDIAGDWSENYGDNNGDGIGDAFGDDITVNGGPGVYRVTYNDQTRAYSITPLTVPVLDDYLIPSNNPITFICSNGVTVPGQSVYAVGNIPELGNWDLANAILLAPNNYPVWESTIEIPTDTNVEWKCVKRDEVNPSLDVIWQNGANTVFDSGVANTTSGGF